MTTAELAELVARDLHHAFMTDSTRRHSEVASRVLRTIEGALYPLTMTTPVGINLVSVAGPVGAPPDPHAGKKYYGNSGPAGGEWR
jgi:hypothetical protein